MKKTISMSLRQRLSFLSSFYLAIVVGVTLLPANLLHAQVVTPVVLPTIPIDSDGDGIPDVIEGNTDIDGDGAPDFLDIDSDNDGLTDADEGAASMVSTTDGLPIDSDGDGIPDYLDLDSDNDGLTDALEAGGSDADSNGIVDGLTDVDGDGYDDASAASQLPYPDNDSDGFADYLDLDSDNDGLPDVWESAGPLADADGDGYLDNLVDANGDGLADNVITNNLLDTDGDGVDNHLDLDSDGDGALDLVEAGGVDLNGDGLVDGWTDSDGDGIIDEYDSNVMATGYLPFMADGQLPTPEDLLDIDQNGVVDVLEVNAQPAPEPALGPAPAPQAALPDVGAVHTGLAGNGCAVSKARAPLDPVLSLLAALAMVSILIHRRRKGSSH